MREAAIKITKAKGKRAEEIKVIIIFNETVLIVCLRVSQLWTLFGLVDIPFLDTRTRTYFVP